MKIFIDDKADSGNTRFGVNLDFTGMLGNAQQNKAHMKLIDRFFTGDFFKCFFADGAVSVKYLAGGYFGKEFI